MAAPRRYVSGIPARYRLFRRARMEERKWYADQGISAQEIGGLELDVIILTMLQAIRQIGSNARLSRHESTATFLGRFHHEFRTQVVVDEVTDFSPIQVACMASLADPAANSFFVCGDFNQRITRWGARTEDDLRWMLACRDGRVIGQEMDVRVFDVQHIKGLEFEAVFLIAVDRLALRERDVFEKYLYVGATRAATFLGMTLEGDDLPAKLTELEPLFDQQWTLTS
jgi:superfamily I DNA/RNA helicase